MKAKTFKIKKIVQVKDKRNWLVSFDLENAEWSNFFELSMKKDDKVCDVRQRIIDKVNIMVTDKDRENELMRTIVGKDISLNGVKDDTSKKDG